jgi:hypothetical protein
LKIISSRTPVTLKLFGSYAENGIYGEGQYGMRGIKSEFSPSVGYFNNYKLPTLQLSDRGNKTRQVGASLGMFNNRLQIDYNYLFNSYSTLVSTFIFNPYKIGIKSYVHRFSISGLITENKNFNWQTTANIATMTTKLGSIPGVISYSLQSYKREWRGGWSNTFRYKKIVAGFNGLYCFNSMETMVRRSPGSGGPAFYEMRQIPNSFLLQHIYLGYKFIYQKMGSCEIYMSARNLLQTRYFELEIGESKYYGIGARVGFD